MSDKKNKKQRKIWVLQKQIIGIFFLFYFDFFISLRCGRFLLYRIQSVFHLENILKYFQIKLNLSRFEKILFSNFCILERREVDCFICREYICKISYNFHTLLAIIKFSLSLSNCRIETSEVRQRQGVRWIPTISARKTRGQTDVCRRVQTKWRAGVG